MPPRSRRLAKALSYAVLVVYVLVIVGSALQGNPATDMVRTVMRPVEKALGIHQTWPMFARAPRGTTWLTLEARRRDGSVETIEALPGRPDPGALRLTYDRLGKLQRQAALKRREKLRMGIVRWACRTEKAMGRSVAKLQVVHHEARTPPPGSGRVPREAFDVSHRGFKLWNCR